MGLMTETPWGSGNPSNGGIPSTDYHQENLKNLKRLSAKTRQLKQQSSSAPRSRQPVKAFAMPDTVDHPRFSPVQPRLYDWTMNGDGPDPPGLPSSSRNGTVLNGHRSPSAGSKLNFAHVQSRVHEWTVSNPQHPDDKNSKKFLKSHEKTGPFVPSSAGSVASGFRRSRPQERVASPVDDLIHVAMASSSGTRFSEVTIEERKRRIQFLVSEIYAVQPLCKEHVTKKTIENNLRRFASCDQVSDIGSVRAGSTRPELQSRMSRTESMSKLNRGLTSSKISVNNFETLTKAQLRKHDARNPPVQPRDLVTMREAQTSPTLRPIVSKSRLSSRSSSLPRQRDRSQSPELPRAQSRAASRASRHSRSETPNGYDRNSVLATGTDIDYVNANIESVSVVGHNRRKEVEEKLAAANVKRPSLILPETYKTGTVPKYLRERQTEWREEAERREREKPDPDCPPHHVRLDEESRIEALNGMRTQYQELLHELSKFSVRADSVRIRERKRDIEDEMTKLEAKMKVYERPKVFVRKF